ncbi:hypothetical protein CONLIGDRAFT_575812 [Coniochaeta ligniaria NRRL 30616]|uniref:Uncharacterized protein n=1 Tax=Coniochaeta ligniaria NRRL 30616 TaxID=1408157 RepID=A0A1J7IQA7_9PEZI|nr:hypothetical protein CONLIGDRAFT_575812 [Coniochaeta ligniaria NRRL 30616]
MCGLDTSTSVRVGARVDLFHESQGHWGSMVFMNPTVPESTTATHVRFTSASAEPLTVRHKSQMLVSIQYVVNIHSFGDMTQPTHQSGMFQQFKLNPNPKRGHSLDTALDQPVLLNVGGDGIIGRRVSMLLQHSPHSPHAPLQEPLLAEGIVGYNC